MDLDGVLALKAVFAKGVLGFRVLGWFLGCEHGLSTEGACLASQGQLAKSESNSTVARKRQNK